MAAVLTTSGRIAIATAIKARTAHLAWGSGDAAWGNTPPVPPGNATALLAEIARRKVNQVDFCTPDAAGAISVPEGKFSISATPTNNLYFKFHFEFADAVGSTIREQAIFLDTVAAAGVPSGQLYLLPAEVAQPGTLLVIERRAPIIREITTRQLFEFVVTF
ncbi:MAG: hypothetical protein RLZZ611_313 [Cyanobacteriota bacterium]|jgi:hypothetical protein